MRKIYNILFMCVGLSMMFTSCKNETVIMDGNSDKKSVEIKEDGKNSSEGIAQTVLKKSDEKLLEIVNRIEEIHPNPYLYRDKKAIIEEGTEMLSNMGENIDSYIFVKRVIALYGNSGIEAEYTEGSRSKIALDIYGDSRGLFVKESQGIFKKGDKLEKIEGMVIEELIAKCADFYPDGCQGSIFDNPEDVFSDEAFLRYATGSTDENMKVEVRRDNLIIAGKVSFQQKTNKTPTRNDFRIYKGNETALLKIVSYKNEEDYEGNKTIDDFFSNVNLLGTKNVVIDMRFSKEVNIDIVNKIGKYLPGETYHTYDKEVKKSSYWKDADFKGEGFFSMFSGKKEKIKDKSSNIFNGNVYILLNNTSGSDSYRVATVLAADFKGEIVGSSRIIERDSFGDPVDIKLQEENISLSLPTTIYSYEGDIDGIYGRERYTEDLAKEELTKEELEGTFKKNR